MTYRKIHELILACTYYSAFAISDTHTTRFINPFLRLTLIMAFVQTSDRSNFAYNRSLQENNELLTCMTLFNSSESLLEIVTFCNFGPVKKS